MEPLFGKSLSEIIAIAKSLSLPAYAPGQIMDWLYRKEISSIGQMSNLSAAARQKLSENFTFGLSKPADVQESADGTKKYLFPALPGGFVESAYIPETGRNTLCLSTQVGCKWGCAFCLTGQMGFRGNLDAAGILNQLRSLPEWKQVDNLVYMGMGEPLDNLTNVLKSIEILTSKEGFGMSPRRITVSTIGILPAIPEFLEKTGCHLAVSLHSPFDEERRQLMPSEKIYPLKQVLDLLERTKLEKQRRVTFEYILFKGLNDTPRHVKELARILNRIRCRINLIRFHPFPGTDLESTPTENAQAFMEALNAKGIRTTLRKSRGQDIMAACGLLSTRNS